MPMDNISCVMSQGSPANTANTSIMSASLHLASMAGRAWTTLAVTRASADAVTRASGVMLR
jgi:hypothetical protein